MNWKRGIARLLIVLLAWGGLIALIILTEKLAGPHKMFAIIILPLTLLVILIGVYCLLRILDLFELISFRRIFHKDKQKEEKKKTDLKIGFTELIVFTAAICCVVFLFIKFSSDDTEGADYFMAFAISIGAVFYLCGLAGIVYAIIMFVARGFAGSSAKDEEKDLRIE
jgi:uncharacterized membrane protein YbhN (UPF0104 family)